MKQQKYGVVGTSLCLEVTWKWLAINIQQREVEDTNSEFYQSAALRALEPTPGCLGYESNTGFNRSVK